MTNLERIAEMRRKIAETGDMLDTIINRTNQNLKRPGYRNHKSR
jgi:hypothetical protein